MPRTSSTSTHGSLTLGTPSPLSPGSRLCLVRELLSCSAEQSLARSAVPRLLRGGPRLHRLPHHARPGRRAASHARSSCCSRPTRRASAGSSVLLAGMHFLTVIRLLPPLPPRRLHALRASRRHHDRSGRYHSEECDGAPPASAPPEHARGGRGVRPPLHAPLACARAQRGRGVRAPPRRTRGCSTRAWCTASASGSHCHPSPPPLSVSLRPGDTRTTCPCTYPRPPSLS
ncbi:hypothetical protein FB451DRAFT_1470065 [Mycena latifolia]|nr:hypothetical protein FB451DRAFT_1470065 [Mycena latifolia]